MMIALAASVDAVSLSVSVNDRVDSHLKHHSIRCKCKVHFDTIVLKLNSSQTSTCCSNVGITLLLPKSLKMYERSTQVNIPRMKS